jgi:Arc/MetJ family transcription regulator
MEGGDRMEALMSEVRVMLVIDDEVLDFAARMFGTRSHEETVKAAVQSAADQQRRGEAFERLGKRAEAGEFDILLDKRNYRI